MTRQSLGDDFDFSALRQKSRCLSLTYVMASLAVASLSVHGREKHPGRPLMSRESPASRRPGKLVLRLNVNGRWGEDAVDESMLLVDYLREVAGLTGVKTGCDGGEC